MSYKNIYIVVEYEKGVYDKDKSSIRAVSDSLDMLFNTYSGSGQLLTIDPCLFNQDLGLTIDEFIVTQKGLEVQDYYDLYLQHKKKNNHGLK